MTIDTKKTCSECGDIVAVEEDPRTPPLDTGNCLCLDCAIGAIDELLIELDEERLELRAQLKKLRKRKKRQEQKMFRWDLQ